MGEGGGGHLRQVISLCTKLVLAEGLVVGNERVAVQHTGHPRQIPLYRVASDFASFTVFRNSGMSI